MTEDVALPVLVHLGPLPDTRNGIADYAATILKHLSKHYRLLCVVERVDSTASWINDIAEVISAKDYLRVCEQLPRMRHISHLGNNMDHVYQIDIMSRVPCTVVLHDITILFLLECWSRATFGSSNFIEGVVRKLQGGPTARLLDTKYSAGTSLVSAYSEVNCLEFLNETASGVIAHSLFGEVKLRAAGYNGNISVIPHFAEGNEDTIYLQKRSKARAQLGVNGDTVLFASLGFVTANKRMDQILEAFARLPAEMVFHFVIGGELRDPKTRELCTVLGLDDRVTFLNYLAPEDFEDMLAGADVLINLRFPTSGETSGTVCRALANRVPCIVSNHGWYAELPDDVSWKIQPGGNETQPQLESTLKKILIDTDTRIRKSQASLDYSKKSLGIEKVIESYRGAIEASWQTQSSHSKVLHVSESALHITQRPVRTVETLPLEPLLDTLEHAFERERIYIGQKAVPFHMDLSAVKCTAALDPPERVHGGPIQQMKALPFQGIIGDVLTYLWEANANLQLGDFITLAVVGEPDDFSAPNFNGTTYSNTQMSDFFSEVNEGFGFTTIRSYSFWTCPSDSTESSVCISVVTFQKCTIAEPSLPYFDVQL